MINKRAIFEIHRLKDTGLSNREIAGQLLRCATFDMYSCANHGIVPTYTKQQH
ncbi:MAG: hypothetical protein GAS50_01765 [Desulfobacterales bacterium]|jgi:hypothetical protein|nr:hypothetical protein [Desulfobacterales bacterium]